MRTILLLPLIVLISLTSFAQDSLPSKTYTEAWYLKKSKRQKIVGASLITVGALGMLTTLFSNAAAIDFYPSITSAFDRGFLPGIPPGIPSGEYQPESKSSAGGYVISAIILIGGVVFLEISGVNKKKALSMTLGMEKTEILNYNVVSKRPFPAVGLKIRI